jgi:hypothetical protein
LQPLRHAQSGGCALLHQMRQCDWLTAGITTPRRERFRVRPTSPQ